MAIVQELRQWISRNEFRLVARLKEMASTKMKFSTEIKKWRKSRKLLLKQAADALGVCLNTYESWEYGYRFPKEMSKPEIRRRMAATPMPPTPTVIVKRLPMGC